MSSKVTVKMVEELAIQMAKFETVPMSFAEQLFDILDRAPDEALQMLVDRKVKFMAPCAALRLMRRAEGK